MPSDAAVAVAVVGATGVLGRALVAAALDAGYTVRAWVGDTSDVTGFDARVSIQRATSTSRGVPSPSALAGTAAVLCAVAGRDNRTCSTLDMRAVEVDFPLSLYAAAGAADPPPSRAVFFAPALAAMAAARGRAPPASEYLTAKEDMVCGLRKAEVAGGARAPRVTVVEVAAWGRDVGAIVAAASAAPPWLPFLPVPVLVSSWTSPRPRLAPLAESDVAARVVSGLARDADAGTTLSLGGPDAVTHAQLWAAVLTGLGRTTRPVGIPLPASLVRSAARSPWLARAVCGEDGRGRRRAGLYLLRIAADAAGAELVGRETVAAAVGVAEQVERAVRERES